MIYRLVYSLPSLNVWRGQPGPGMASMSKYNIYTCSFFLWNLLDSCFKWEICRTSFFIFQFRVFLYTKINFFSWKLWGNSIFGLSWENVNSIWFHYRDSCVEWFQVNRERFFEFNAISKWNYKRMLKNVIFRNI